MAYGLRAKALIAVMFVALCGAIAGYVYLYVHPWHYSYKGDGAFTDNGITASSYRYVLKLGTYNLTSSVGKKQEFLVGVLPQNDMRLALKFVLAEGEPRELIDDLRIRVSVSKSGETKPYYVYEGKLYSPDAGFTPTTYKDSSNRTVLVMYSREPFTQSVSILGKPTGLYQQGEREVAFELLAPIAKPLRNNEAELVIFGGGWK